jgi:sugar transferase (PEP-CTERM/EpsH1 system associated)
VNILFLAHRIPYPPDKGDKIRSFNIIKHLAQKHEIFLGTVLEETSDRDYLTGLKNYCKEICAADYLGKSKLIKSILTNKPFSVSNFYDKKLQDYVDGALDNKNIGAVICFCSSMAEYVFNTPLFVKNKLSGIQLIMDYVDLDSDKWRQYSDYSLGYLKYIYNIENRRLFRYEMEINKVFNHSVFVSQREVETFRQLYPDLKDVHVISNGVDYDYFSPEPTRNALPVENSKTHPKIVFTGVMDYFANEEGVIWFCDKIFQQIRTEIPHAQFYIVGNRPTNTVWSLSELDGVTVTGYVEDIREYYWKADICAIPLRIARGLQNKVIEAMATGNAVVATSNASNGIICNKNEDIVVADGEEEFALEVIKLLRDGKRRKEMGLKAVENIRKNYSWKKNLNRLDSLLQTDA